MTSKTKSSVVCSYLDDGNFRLRQLVVTNTRGTCIVSFTLLKLQGNHLAVPRSRDWAMDCILHGETLPMIPDQMTKNGWRINRELTPEEVERLQCHYRIINLKETG